MRTPHVTHLLIPALVLVATTGVSAQELTKEEVPSPVLKEFALDFVR